MNRRLIAAAAAVAFVGSVYLANWLVQHVGPIRVWPTSFLAPAGVYVIGLAFLLRDTVQRFSSNLVALACVAVGALLSLEVSPTLAVASAVAFALSETTGVVLFAALGGRRAGPARLGSAVAVSSIAAAALDSLVFLWMAFHSLAFFDGQLIAKLSVTALAFPFVLAARRALPTPTPKGALAA